MNISSNNQLVPYHQRPPQLMPYWQRDPVYDPARRFPATQQYVRTPLSQSAGYNANATGENSIYTSSRRLKLPEMNRVGSLIDIYA